MEKEELIKQVETWKETVETVLNTAVQVGQISPICKNMLVASLMTLQEILNGKTIKEQFDEAIRKEKEKEGKHE